MIRKSVLHAQVCHMSVLKTVRVTLPAGVPCFRELNGLCRAGALWSKCCAAAGVQVMLQPGCALMAAGDAYWGHLHGISAAVADIVGPLCCNTVAAGVTVGQSVQRAPRRLSLVFVRKRHQ